MDFTYTSEQRELQARAAALAAEIMVHEEDCEAAEGLPPEIHADVADRVRATGSTPSTCRPSGAAPGLSVLEQVIVQEQLGPAHQRAVGHGLAPGERAAGLRRGAARALPRPGIRGERRDCVAVTERDAGSDPSAIATTAVRDGGGWVIDGEKWFVTVGDAADYLLVLALACPSARRRCSWSTRTRRASRCSASRATCTRSSTSTRSSASPACAWATERCSAASGEGYELTRDWFVEERLMIGARAIGAAERALRVATEWAGERVQGGGPIVGHQLIQGMIADSVVDIATNRALVHQVAWEADQGLDRKLLHAKAAVVKLAASEAAGRVVDRAVQIIGGRGYMREHPFERLYRDIRVDRIWEGTSEIQRLIIGNEVGKRGLDGVLAFGPAPAPRRPAPR